MCAFEATSLPPHNSLEFLPPELILEITQYLDCGSCISLLLTCKRLHPLLQDYEWLVDTCVKLAHPSSPARTLYAYGIMNQRVLARLLLHGCDVTPECRFRCTATLTSRRTRQLVELNALSLLNLFIDMGNVNIAAWLYFYQRPHSKLAWKPSDFPASRSLTAACGNEAHRSKALVWLRKFFQMDRMNYMRSVLCAPRTQCTIESLTFVLSSLFGRLNAAEATRCFFKHHPVEDVIVVLLNICENKKEMIEALLRIQACAHDEELGFLWTMKNLAPEVLQDAQYLTLFLGRFCRRTPSNREHAPEALRLFYEGVLDGLELPASVPKSLVVEVFANLITVSDAHGQLKRWIVMHTCFEAPSQPLRSALKLGGQSLALQLVEMKPALLEGIHLADTFKDAVKSSAFELAFKLLKSARLSPTVLQEAKEMLKGNETGILEERVAFKQELRKKIFASSFLKI